MSASAAAPRATISADGASAASGNAARARHPAPMVSAMTARTETSAGVPTRTRRCGPITRVLDAHRVHLETIRRDVSRCIVSLRVSAQPDRLPADNARQDRQRSGHFSQVGDEREDLEPLQLADWLRRALSRLSGTRPERPFSRLTTCLACSAARMCPVSWAEGEHGAWWLRLRCGECGAFSEAVTDAAEAERYELDLEIAGEEIAELLVRFEHAAMLARSPVLDEGARARSRRCRGLRSRTAGLGTSRQRPGRGGGRASEDASLAEGRAGGVRAAGSVHSAARVGGRGCEVEPGHRRLVAAEAVH